MSVRMVAFIIGAILFVIFGFISLAMLFIDLVMKYGLLLASVMAAIAGIVLLAFAIYGPDL